MGAPTRPSCLCAGAHSYLGSILRRYPFLAASAGLGLRFLITFPTRGFPEFMQEVAALDLSSKEGGLFVERMLIAVSANVVKKLDTNESSPPRLLFPKTYFQRRVHTYESLQCPGSRGRLRVLGHIRRASDNCFRVCFDGAGPT